VRGLAELAEAVPDCRPQVVVNRVRRGPINGDVESEISQALSRYAGIQGVVFVPYDGVSLDKAIAGGRSLSEAAPDSPVRLALQPLAAHYAGVSTTEPRRRRSHRSGRRTA
jgi:MinD-like ATPase involved in chromosome partitioning or flagellar assembly